jgi:hypothetical protein
MGGKSSDAARIITDLGDQAFDNSEAVQMLWTGFLSDDTHGLYLENRNVKAMLKESANIVRKFYPNAKGKSPPLKSQLAERVFVKPDRVYLGRAQPDGYLEKPIHVMTAQGPRTALKRVDHCDDVKLELALKVLDDGLITEKILRGILEHAAENGLGTDRSQGSGTFEILRFEAA